MERQHNYYIEMRQVGSYIKVTAIDPETGVEASVVASPKLNKNQLSDLAIKKLKYVLKKREN